MKHPIKHKFIRYITVASLAEAWIETFHNELERHRHGVASLAEAWIETSGTRWKSRHNLVASLAEAWIETVVKG